MFLLARCPLALLVFPGWGLRKSTWSYPYGNAMSVSAQPSTCVRVTVLRRSRESWGQLWDLSARYVPALRSSCICIHLESSAFMCRSVY